jgi:hypothetical protein
MACKETTEARLECKEPISVDMESEAKYREVSKEHAAVQTGETLRKRRRGRKLAAGRRGEPKELTRGECGSRRNLAAAWRKLSRRTAVARRKRNVFRKVRIEENCGPRKELATAGIRITHCTRVAWQTRKIISKFEPKKIVDRPRNLPPPE